jgi:hypothetical protein
VKPLKIPLGILNSSSIVICLHINLCISDTARLSLFQQDYSLFFALSQSELTFAFLLLDLDKSMQLLYPTFEM